METSGSRHQQSASERPERHGDAADRAASEAARERWDSAIDNPEARAFLKRATERRERMERQGLIQRP